MPHSFHPATIAATISENRPETALKITIVIPTVDRRQSLLRAVTACMMQAMQPGTAAEIVVIDNSPDGRQAWIVGAATAEQPGTAITIRCVHEPRPGLAHARNKGVATAQGAYVVFLDDDECPKMGWLAALTAALDATGADAAFGSVVPVFEQKPKRLERFAQNLYTRRLDAASHADISTRFNLLGTGNSCFRAATCFSGNPEPFDIRFNQTGGEDTDLLRRLTLQGRRLVWTGDAVVEEFVPADRLTPGYMAARRFMQGQMRTLSHMASSPRRPDKAAFWMAAGAAQYAGYSMVAALDSLLGRDEMADSHRIQAQGGLGKVLWQSRFRAARYGT